MNKNLLSTDALIYNGNKVSLSSREIEILSIICRGYTAKSTAEKLDISIRTVQHHINNIKQKTDTHHRTDLAKLYESCFYVNKLNIIK